MKLNNLIKTNKKKLDLVEALDQEKEKLLVEDTKVKKLDQELLLKALREAKCLYLEGCPNVALNPSKNQI